MALRRLRQHDQPDRAVREAYNEVTQLNVASPNLRTESSANVWAKKEIVDMVLDLTLNGSTLAAVVEIYIPRRDV